MCHIGAGNERARCCIWHDIHPTVCGLPAGAVPGGETDSNDPVDCTRLILFDHEGAGTFVPLISFHDRKRESGLPSSEKSNENVQGENHPTSDKPEGQRYRFTHTKYGPAQDIQNLIDMTLRYIKHHGNYLWGHVISIP